MIDVDKCIEENREENYQKFQKKIIKTNYEIVGVRVGKLRKLAKELDDYFSSDNYEKLLLSGFVLANDKNSIKDKTDLIYKYLSLCDNWALIDSFVSSLKVSRKDKEYFWNLINGYLNDENEYVVRFVIVTYLNKYIDDEYIDRVLENCLSISREEYYIQMAIAWLLQVASINYFDKVLSVINNFDKKIISYYKRKMLDSYRISLEVKEKVRKL